MSFAKNGMCQFQRRIYKMKKYGIIIYFILLPILIGCSDSSSSDSSGSDSSGSETKNNIRKIFPEKLAIDLPESIRNNSRTISKSLSGRNDLFDLILTKYSQILWDEYKYLFTKDFEIYRGDLVDGICIDKDELSSNWTASQTAEALQIGIDYLNTSAYPKSEATIKASEMQGLIDSGFSFSGYANPALYKKIDDDLYEKIVMSSYDHHNDSNSKFCNQNGEKLDNVTTGDYVAWMKNDTNERFAGMSAAHGVIKGAYYDKSLKFSSFFRHSNYEESLSGNEINWNRYYKESGSFLKCGEGCVSFKGSGFTDNDTFFEMTGVLDETIGSYFIAKIMHVNGTVYFKEEYWRSDNSIIFSKDGSCSGYSLENASSCISNNSSDNLSSQVGTEPTSSSWSKLLQKADKFFNLSHKLDISNLSGADKTWLLFNTNQVASDGRVPWHKIDGIVFSDNNSNFVNSMVRYPQVSGSKNYYAYEVDNLANGPILGSYNAYMPPNANTPNVVVTLVTQ